MRILDISRYSFSVMSKLPPTSYVRLVDIWLINGQLVPFLEVIILTILELKREGVSAINHHGFARLIIDFQSEWSTLIDRDCRDRALIGRGLYRTDVAPPALLCHKEPARRIQSPLVGASKRKIPPIFCLLIAGSLWHKG